jgi:large subunit ribosomal protein L14e
MVALNTGRVCMKIAGREAGRYCVVLKKESDAFVLITGPKLLTGVKRRKSNIEHLEPTDFLVEIKDEAGDEEVIAALDKAGLMNKLGLKRPSAAEIKAEKTKPVKEQKPKEKPGKEDKKEKKK